MRNRFDQFAKQLGQDALGPSGTTVANDPINPETQYADLRHEPDPARQAERDRLGLLGRIAAFLCLIEIYSEAPSGEAFRACLTKHLVFWQQRARKARSDKRRDEQAPREVLVDPFLWIISAGTPTNLLTKLRIEPARGWPTGVYQFGDDVLRVGVIVASELPRERATLLVRLMAAGPLLAMASRELATLPLDAPERVIAEPALLHFQHVLGQASNLTSSEQEFVMAMYQTWEERKAEGRAEGRAEGQAEGLLIILGARGIAVPDAARAAILAEKDEEQLKRWLQRAVSATSVEDVIGPR